MGLSATQPAKIESLSCFRFGPNDNSQSSSLSGGRPQGKSIFCTIKIKKNKVLDDLLIRLQKSLRHHPISVDKI
jgi:hypothetical protein